MVPDPRGFAKKGAELRTRRLTRVFVLVAGLAASQERPGVSRDELAAFERSLASELPAGRAVRETERGGGVLAGPLDVELPDGRSLPIFVHLPPDFDRSRRWPLVFAMHGGPTRGATSALRGALGMIDVWREPAAESGWLVAAPAMTHVVARGARTAESLPYEILTSTQIDAILRDVARVYPIDPNRIVSTGISLGSNFSIAYAAARPDRLAAIVPVSTEGESREHLLRNLMHVPTFVLEGALDRNIRDIRGPRALAAILDELGYDHVYQELSDRSHEGFAEHYPDVLRWLAERPRNPYPQEIVRVPHSGIMPLARRVHWVESDTRRGLIHARVTTPTLVEIDTRWVRTLRVYVHDRLVDLDEPIEIIVNGESVFRRRIPRSLDFVRDDVRATGDPGRTYAAVVDVDVPSSAGSLVVARRLSASMQSRRSPGALSFWETYAMRSLEDRLPPLGIEGEETGSGAREQTTIRIDAVVDDSPFHLAGVKVGDELIAVDGEPFFTGGGLEGLRAWLARELAETPRALSLSIRRGGKEHTLLATLSLEPF